MIGEHTMTTKPISKQMKPTEKLLDKYVLVTGEALEMAKKAPVRDKRAHEVIDMAQRYVSDAQFFIKKGDEERALAALSYAHGWLDCGARLVLFEVHDDRLFTVDSKEATKK